MMKGFMFSAFCVTFAQCAPLYMDHQVQEDYVPILGYHAIGDTTDSLTVTVEDYRDQVDYLTNNMNCNWITMKDLSVYVTNGEKLPTNACVMTFDDGTSDHYHEGLCTLNVHGVPATYYILPSDVGSSSFYMSASEVDKLYGRGHDIGSHTSTHPYLSQLTNAQQDSEINDSKTALEAMGYSNVATFAYPFGDYNEDTLDLLRQSDYVLARDTSQDNSWKDIRTPVVSFNEDNNLHFFYIKPEGYSGSQLADLIGYNGWWQLEDNFKVIFDSGAEIKVRSSSSFHPTSTSFAVLVMNEVDDEISTQFITKNTGSFTLDILLSGTDIFEVKVDGTVYTPTVFGVNDPERLFLVSSDGKEYYNYYVNVPSLSSGVHTLNIVNTQGVTMILDKFRLWSNTNQDFSYSTPYSQCDPATDDYCICDAPPIPDPLCELGLIFDDICCSASCGTCGGTGCGSRDGGAANCCGGTITASGLSCDVFDAPCVITPPPTPAPIPDPACDLGLISGNTCCAASCGTCGGTGCGSRPGGASSCCSGPIAASGLSCDVSDAPCVIGL